MVRIPPIRLGCEGNALYLDVDTYRLLTRRASNSKMIELNCTLRQLNPLNPRARNKLKITGFDLTTENAQALIQTSVGAPKGR